MHVQMVRDRPLRVTVRFNGLRDLPVALLPVLHDRGGKELFQRRPMGESLAPGNLRNSLVPPQSVRNAVAECFFSQDRLPAHLMPDRLPDPLLHELPVLPLRSVTLASELPQHPRAHETGMSRFPARRGPVAAPFPESRSIDHLRPNGIKDNIPAHFEQVAVFLDQDGLVPPLEQMPGPAVRLIEELRVHTVQLAHAESQVAVRSLYEQMIMIVHQAVGVADPVIAFVDVLKRVEELMPILVGPEDRLPLVASGGHMIYCTGVFNAKGAGHDGRISKVKDEVKHYRPDPKMFPSSLYGLLGEVVIDSGTYFMTFGMNIP